MTFRKAIVLQIYFHFRRVAKQFDVQIMDKSEITVSAILNF